MSRVRPSSTSCRVASARVGVRISSDMVVDDQPGEHVEHSCSVASAAGSPSQNRRRDRRTYQLDRSSMKPASRRPARCGVEVLQRRGRPRRRAGAARPAPSGPAAAARRAPAPACAGVPAVGLGVQGEERRGVPVGAAAPSDRSPSSASCPTRRADHGEPPASMNQRTRVGAVPVHQRDRLEDVAQVLAHLAAVLGEDVARGTARSRTRLGRTPACRPPSACRTSRGSGRSPRR